MRLISFITMADGCLMKLNVNLVSSLIMFCTVIQIHGNVLIFMDDDGWDFGKSIMWLKILMR